MKTDVKIALFLCLAAGGAAMAAFSGVFSPPDDPRIIPGDQVSTLALPTDRPPPPLEVAAIPAGTVAIYDTEGDWRREHIFHAPENGLYPVEIRDVGPNWEKPFIRILYDSDGAVVDSEEPRGPTGYLNGACETKLGPCKTAGATIHTMISEDGAVRRMKHLGAGSVLLTYTIGDRWGIRTSEEHFAANGGYAKMTLAEIRLPEPPATRSAQ